MSDDSMSSYDLVPYLDAPYSDTHPGRLATVATLYGLNPPSIDRCRVLELGCASGSNLLPMADALPGSQFLGLDLSARQVEAGLRVIEAVGLTNVELRTMSLLDVDESLGQFDYILCHGVYSWVPEPARRKILDIVRRNLTPDGVAYVSYNTDPGWHLRRIVRDLMTYRASEFPEPEAQIEQSREILEFVAQSAWNPGGAYARFLKEQVERLRQKTGPYLFHEYLEEVNEPVYFHQFVEQARSAGLRHVADARIGSMAENVAPSLRTRLDSLTDDPIRREQYLDFLRGRSFRRSLLCHERVEVSPTARPEAVAGLGVSAIVAPLSAQPDLTSRAVERFRTASGSEVVSDDPVVKMALLILQETIPGSLPFGRLWAGVQERLGTTTAAAQDLTDGDRRLQTMLLQGYAGGWVVLEARPAQFESQPGDRPRASALSRYQAEVGSQVVSRWHQVVELSRFDRQVLRHLDGQRDREALVAVLAGLVDQGQLEIRGAGPERLSPEQTRTIIAQALEASLNRLALSALLVS